MPRPHQRKVAAVHRQHLHDVESLGGRNHTRIDEAEWRVEIDAHEISRPLDIFGREPLERELAIGDGSRERKLGVCTNAPAQEIGHFGQHNDRNENIFS